MNAVSPLTYSITTGQSVAKLLSLLSLEDQVQVVYLFFLPVSNTSYSYHCLVCIFSRPVIPMETKVNVTST